MGYTFAVVVGVVLSGLGSNMYPVGPNMMVSDWLESVNKVVLRAAVPVTDEVGGHVNDGDVVEVEFEGCDVLRTGGAAATNANKPTRPAIMTPCVDRHSSGRAFSRKWGGRDDLRPEEIPVAFERTNRMKGVC